jgi:hypothetical protein
MTEDEQDERAWLLRELSEFRRVGGAHLAMLMERDRRLDKLTLAPAIAIYRRAAEAFRALDVRHPELAPLADARVRYWEARAAQVERFEAAVRQGCDPEFVERIAAEGRVLDEEEKGIFEAVSELARRFGLEPPNPIWKLGPAQVEQSVSDEIDAFGRVVFGATQEQPQRPCSVERLCACLGLDFDVERKELMAAMRRGLPLYTDGRDLVLPEYQVPHWLAQVSVGERVQTLRDELDATFNSWADSARAWQRGGADPNAVPAFEPHEGPSLRVLIDSAVLGELWPVGATEPARSPRPTRVWRKTSKKPRKAN